MVKRPQKELQSHLHGSATFIEDLNVSNQLHLLFLRSPVAHARVRRIDTSKVGSADGVAVFTGSNLRRLLAPNVWREYPLAETEVVYEGQPMAAVVSSKRSTLEDSLERISVDYEPLRVIWEPADAVSSTDRWLSTASSNIVLRQGSEAGRPAEALKNSPYTLNLRFRLPRISPYPIEGRGIVVQHSSTGTVIYSSTQSPYQLQQFLLNSTAEPGRVRVIQTAVGGAFGGKLFPYAEDLACYLVSTILRRSVKWIPLPEEKLVTLTHRPDQTHDVQVGYDGSGRILALKDHALVDAGAFFGGSAGSSMEQPGTEIAAHSTAINQMVSMATGPYNIKNVEIRVTAVATNKVMMGPIRGSGGMTSTFILERVLNQIAIRLGLDQFTVREVNLISGDSSFTRGPLGVTLPQLRFTDLLKTARDSRVTRAVMRPVSRSARRSLWGVGVSFYLAESAPPSAESVRLELIKGGKLILFSSVAPTGQGSERTLATIILRKLRTRKSAIEVRFGDTTTSHLGLGTLSSRSIAYAGSATTMACDLLICRIKELLGRSSRVGPASVSFRAGLFRVRYGGGKSRDLDFSDVANELGDRTAVNATYKSEASTFSSGCHISLVEIDRFTGSVKVLRHLTFDDFGTVLDPNALTAQTEGCVLQSIGEALQEKVEYDRNSLVNGSYFIPSALPIPMFSHVLIHLTTSQHLHGARGAGEAGRIGSLPAIVNAVENALSKAGKKVFLTSTPISNESIYMILSGR